MDRIELERDLRSRLSHGELRQVTTQLEGAVQAIELLRDRAPHFVRAFFADVQMVSADDMSDRAQRVLSALADELRASRLEQQAPPRPMESRQALRLAYSGAME